MAKVLLRPLFVQASRPETWNFVIANAQRISFVCIGYFDIKISTCYSLKIKNMLNKYQGVLTY